ncbi:MAG: transglycosylase SLT domain-containing protein [Armatimonadia bacterium]
MLWTGRTVPPEDPRYAAAAARQGLDLALVLAIVEHESSFRPGAVKREPNYRYVLDVSTWKPFRRLTDAEAASPSPPADFPAPPGVTRDAEWTLQRMSFGLLQCMGALARERNYTARWLDDLIADVEAQLDIGCAHLAAKVAKYRPIEAAISAFNAGSPRVLTDAAGRTVYANQVYVDAVLPLVAKYRARIAES